MQELMKRLTGFQTRLLMALLGVAPADLERSEQDQTWSAREIVAHLGDVELVTAMRLRLMLVQDTPELQPFAQNEWVARLHRGVSVEDLLEQFRELRRSNLRLLASLSVEELDRTGVHPARGLLTVQDLAGFVADHQDRHLGQIERVKAALGLLVGPTGRTD